MFVAIFVIDVLLVPEYTSYVNTSPASGSLPLQVTLGLVEIFVAPVVGLGVVGLLGGVFGFTVVNDQTSLEVSDNDLSLATTFQ